jgi:Uncharacterized small protein
MSSVSSAASTAATAAAPAASTHLPDWLAIVRAKVESLRFGVVQIVVHDGKVTQIERTEKTRLSGPGRDE